MALTTYLTHQASAATRAKADQLLLQNAVTLHEGDRDLADATVEDDTTHEVSVQRQDKSRLAGWCTCALFRQAPTICPHLWAVLRKAETLGYLRGTTTRDPYRFRPDRQGLAQYYREEEEDFDEGRFLAPLPEAAGRTRQPKKRGGKAKKPAWQQSLAQLNTSRPTVAAPLQPQFSPGREIVYILDLENSLTRRQFLVEIAMRERKKNGEWSKPKSHRIDPHTVATLPDATDREILSLLRGAPEFNSYSYYSGFNSYGSSRFQLVGPLLTSLLPRMCGTGRSWLRTRNDATGELRPLLWEDGPPWELWVSVEPNADQKGFTVTGNLRRGDARLALTDPVLLLSDGILLFQDRVARFDHGGAFNWVDMLKKQESLHVPAGQAEEFLTFLYRLPVLPQLELPTALQVAEVQVTPRPRLKVTAPTHTQFNRDRLQGALSFDYEGALVDHNVPGPWIYDSEHRRRLRRDLRAEEAAQELLRQLGFRQDYYYGDSQSRLYLPAKQLPKVVRSLLAENWLVEAEGKLYRQPGEIDMEVVSGIDWFDLSGTVSFEGQVVKLPALLAALRRGENTVRLDDGTFGVVPEEWLKKYGLLAGLGKEDEEGNLRFGRAQVGLLDALLATQPAARWDQGFDTAREELRRFSGIEPAEPPTGFVGALRQYQKEGLGWLHFLRRFHLGGCLADDMGLGKTVQVLALLEARREQRAAADPAPAGKEKLAPSLLVVPRSLIFNWMQEAARFAPQLHILDYSGTGRGQPGPHFHDYDVILTTYGTLRRDAAALTEFPFDYCILDEAQAIKNAKSESAKAVRLMQASHRLAMSGTPIENHLGELWSLFEFLNPGMLGSASVFQLTGAGARNPSAETRELLAKALRPFILRRTKQQVAKDLPPKLEQTIYCDLEPQQRKLYDELRTFYRASLLHKIEQEGWNKAKIQILEALLRLRQAACHPALLDKNKANESSAKLDVLLPQLTQVAQGGHKALVFSQFTSFLALVRAQLDKEGIAYEYLDGRTRNRQEKVEKFQSNPDCKLFLISLKAGGLGLNLTAAEYVFLLDPWWNPAVEAQAIDRTHRIGQTHQVFAYRIIARDTVEEKVLQLQETKRNLADAIISADNSLIRDLKREDLELLLS